ncbi:hypothetical protein CIRG_06065 [Coccidioides immitis RMSCC 2394]|uniref:Uncharacterized protein n=1 Tax=Coccidioides immitis RMSCC 2394 TaxID=404692 RepID=A0A0J6YH32_COCIT|nr:hypothetical protein CIRG_06065 [Coccidioides immitis RMSCC 2394]
MSGDFSLGVHGNMSQQEGSTMGLGRADRRTLVLLGQVLALGRHRAFSPAHSTFLVLSGKHILQLEPVESYLSFCNTGGQVVNGHGSTVARNPTILKGRTRPIIDTIAWGDILFGTIDALVSKPLQNIASSLVYKANNVPNQPAASQTGLPPVPAQQGSQQAFGGYPHLNPQYGGLGGLGTHHQTGASQTHHQGGGYGNYGAGFGTNYYGNTGRGGGWGGSYYTGKG